MEDWMGPMDPLLRCCCCSRSTDLSELLQTSKKSYPHPVGTAFNLHLLGHTSSARSYHVGRK